MFWWEKFNFLTFFVTKLKIFEIFIKIFCFLKIFRKNSSKTMIFAWNVSKIEKIVPNRKKCCFGVKIAIFDPQMGFGGTPPKRGSGPDPPSKTPFLARGTGFGQVPFAVHRLKNPIIFFAIFDGDVLPPTPVLFWVSGGSPKMAIFGPFFGPSRGPKSAISGSKWPFSVILSWNVIFHVSGRKMMKNRTFHQLFQLLSIFSKIFRKKCFFW